MSNIFKSLRLKIIRMIYTVPAIWTFRYNQRKLNLRQKQFFQDRMNQQRFRNREPNSEPKLPLNYTPNFTLGHVEQHNF